MAENKSQPSRSAAAGEDSALEWGHLMDELREANDSHPDQTPPPSGNTTVDDRTPRLSESGADLSRYERLCKTPTLKLKKADVEVMTEFSNIIARVNDTGRVLTELHRQHPDVLPDRIYKTVRENLKETAMVMLREFHEMRHGRAQKKYDKKYVCERCHGVFMVPLPADNICDCCRSEKTPGSGRY